MTPDEITAINKACAERLGLTMIMVSRLPNFHNSYDNAAELLVQKARERGWRMILENPGAWVCSFERRIPGHWNVVHEGRAETAPAAICKAFLQLPIPTP